MDELKIFEKILKSQKKSSNTIEGYLRDVSQLLNYVNKDVKLIDSNDIMDFMYTLNHLESTTINRKLSAIKMFFKYLNITNILSTNPAEDIECVSEEKKEYDYVPFENLSELIKYGKNPRDKAIMALFLVTAIRVSELINIKLVDYLNDNIKIKGKGRVERYIYLNDECKYYINEYLKVRKESDIPNLFVSNQGTVMDRNVLNRTLKVIKSKANLPNNVTCHTFRHATASKICKENGVKMACDFLKHSSVAVTERYCHTNEDQIRDMAMAIKL